MGRSTLTKRSMWTWFYLFVCPAIYVGFAAAGTNLCADVCTCGATQEYLNCTGRLSAAFPNITLPNTTKSLIFDSNNASVIPANVLTSAPMLRFLSVRYNKIRIIDNTTQLCIATKLQHFYADSNRIIYISPEAFKGCSNLMTLSLRGNILHIDLIAPLLPSVPKLAVLDCGLNVFGTPTILPIEFQSVSQLHALFLDSMEIRYIPTNFTANLNSSRFHQLSLAGNVFVKISPDAFSDLTSLEILDISETQLLLNDSLSIFSAIKCSPTLHRIDMKGNFIFDKLTKFDNDHLFRVLENNTIRILHIEQNYGGFQGLLHRDFLTPLRHLEELYLDHNELRIIHHKALSMLHQLKILSLRDNYLSCLTDCEFLSGATRLPQLQKLDLSNNVIDDSAGYLAFYGDAFPVLRHLNLRNNRISTIYDDLFFSVKTIRTLDISENPIRAIERECFVTQARLKRLVIENCFSIEELPALMFSGLSALTELSLRENNIKTIYNDTWVGLNILQHLDISHNNLGANGRAPELVLLSTNLTTIDLSYNSIQQIPKEFIRNGSTLRKLILGHNRISSIQKSTFRHFTNLSKLDLSYNDFMTIDVDVFQYYSSSLYWLDLSGNPFYCNCEAQSLITWLRSNRDIIAHESITKCLGPQQQAQKLLLNYNPANGECKSNAVSHPQMVLTLSVVLLSISIVLLTVCIALCVYQCRRNRSLNMKNCAPNVANEITVSVTCPNQNEVESVSHTRLVSNNCDRSKTKASFLMKCIPLKLFSRKERIPSENGHMDTPLIENQQESEANI